MNWTIDRYAIGRKGVYRLVYRGPTLHAQILMPGSGFWDDILPPVVFSQGRCPAVEAYDAAPNGWEQVTA